MYVQYIVHNLHVLILLLNPTPLLPSSLLPFPPPPSSLSPSSPSSFSPPSFPPLSLSSSSLSLFFLPLSPPATVELPLTEDELVDVQVVLANSPADFYVHLVGEEHSDALEALVDEMQMHFTSSNARPPGNGMVQVEI